MKFKPVNLAFFIIFALCSPLYAGQSVCPDGQGGVSGYSARGNVIQGCLYYDATPSTQTEYDRVKTLFKTVPQQHIKIVNNSPEEMTASEKTAVNDAMAAAQTASIRSGAKAQLTGFSDLPLYQRALADILKDEINILRDWTADFKAEVAAASNLADLKTRVAGLPTLNDRTLAQLKTALENKIDGGSVDNG